VQTFVPYADFARTAAVLDTKRLGKQRVEVIQIVRALTVPGYAWSSHPAVLMWKGHEEALGRYGLAMCEEWRRRGFGDTCAETIAADLASAGVDRLRSYPELVEGCRRGSSTSRCRAAIVQRSCARTPSTTCRRSRTPTRGCPTCGRCAPRPCSSGSVAARRLRRGER